VLLQDRDDLFFRKAIALHALVLSAGQNELQAGLGQRGKVSRSPSCFTIVSLCYKADNLFSRHIIRSIKDFSVELISCQLDFFLSLNK